MGSIKKAIIVGIITGFGLYIVFYNVGKQMHEIRSCMSGQNRRG
jgi:hypothetical protein|nr:MAG TPA: hypothetical protein [Caudoviricetes sp.]